MCENMLINHLGGMFYVTFAILILIMLFSKMLKLSILFIYNNKLFWKKILSRGKYLICQNEDIKFSLFFDKHMLKLLMYLGNVIILQLLKVKLQSLIIIILKEARLKKQGQHIIIQQKEVTITNLLYFNNSNSKW